jgi:hypothetical protein
MDRAIGHAGSTLAIALIVVPRLWWLAAAEFLVDRAKPVVGHHGALSTNDARS